MGRDVNKLTILFFSLSHKKIKTVEKELRENFNKEAGYV